MGRNTSNALLGAALAALALSACDRPVTRGFLPPPRVQAPADAARTAAQAQPPAEVAPIAPLPPREVLTDTAITARIKTAMLSDPALTGADISVTTDHGAVTLTGTVKNQEQIGVASALAQREDGITRVDNHLSPAPQ